MARTKRAPGSGHLTVRTDSAGRENWYGKWYAEGRQVMRKIGPKRTSSGRGLDRREAERRLRKLIDEAPPPEASRVDVAQAGRALIEHLRALGRKPATIEAYDSLLRVHLAPYFSGRSLDAITVEQIESFVAATATEGKSPKTIGNALGFLHSIFRFAQKRGWGRGNPCEHIDRPRNQAAAEIRFLDAQELEAVVSAERAYGDELAPTLAIVVLAAAMTGLRQGELIALRWEDVDWSAARVRVRRSYVRGEFSVPKSRRGVRSVPLADRLAAELERHFQAPPSRPTTTSSSPTRASAVRSTAPRCESASRRRSVAPGSERSASTTSATRSVPGWRRRGSRCAPCRSGWATAISRRR